MRRYTNTYHCYNQGEGCNRYSIFRKCHMSGTLTRGWRNVDFGYTVDHITNQGALGLPPLPTPQKRKLLMSYVKKHTQIGSMLHFWSSTYKDTSLVHMDTSKMND